MIRTSISAAVLALAVASPAMALTDPGFESGTGGWTPTIAGNLQALPSGTLYLPEATSLRMSKLGYQNDAQSGLEVSYNALDHYVRDLDRAIAWCGRPMR